ncbi:S1C family serine protease [Actinoplanes sp. DH11]|uniref:S1C family serine protease n=1 Tax=Actinoplanes sp. DH11 TaxID=2857011 RepID=UPI001E420431|nr:trypsin-like peptidase domain-containing protein [Actinoplanes sp. DH11]
MTITGLGATPRGPEFLSPVVPALPPPEPAPTPGVRRWPLLLAGGLAVVAVSAGTGGAAGYLTGRDDTGRGDSGTPPYAAPAPAPAGVPADLVAAAARALPGVVSVQVRTGSGGASGSGFVFDDRGHIVTNAHVVAGGRGGAVSVVGADGRRLTAEVVGSDTANDIAVLRVAEATALPRLDLADPRGTRVGEPVLAVGSPLGLSGTVTAGIVSALDRQVRLGGATRQTAVQTDASINPGNSGGPLVNARGEVVGVNTAIATLEGGGSIGIGFAVPIERARQVAAGLIGRG